jgi:hypothetical protein
MFWDIIQCYPLKDNRHFASIFRIEVYAKQQTSTANKLLHGGFLLGLFFDPEDGSDVFIRNAG